MADAIKITGGSYCCDITITGEVSSDKIIACHRTDCQKFNGAPFRAVAVIAADGAKISGTVTEFLKISESGNERVHGFCGKCGSHLYATDPAKTLFMIRTGCHDQHHELVPAKHIFGKSAVECVSEIADPSWVSEGPASTDMTPFKKAQPPCNHAYWRLICGAMIHYSLDEFNGCGVLLSAVINI